MTEVRLYRYVRPVKLNVSTLELDHLPKGGISFCFLIDQEANKLFVSYSICPDDENFSYKIGQNVVKGRMLYNKNFIVTYDRSISLIENVVSFFNKGPHISQLRQVSNKLKKILKQNDIEKSNQVELYNKMEQRFKNANEVTTKLDALTTMATMLFSGADNIFMNVLDDITSNEDNSRQHSDS
jgi:hypothetical protein